MNFNNIQKVAKSLEFDTTRVLSAICSSLKEPGIVTKLGVLSNGRAVTVTTNEDRSSQFRWGKRLDFDFYDGDKCISSVACSTDLSDINITQVRQLAFGSEYAECTFTPTSLRVAERMNYF